MNDTFFLILGNLAFALIAAQYLVRDIFLLRTLSIASCIAGIAYNYFVPDEPLWTVIIWNFIFMGINLVQIAILLNEKRGVSFSEEEKELYQTVFKSFSPVEFMKLLRVGEWKNADNGSTLVVEHAPLNEVMLIYNGAAEVIAGGRKVATLKDGSFIGEMSYITGNPPSATVKTITPTKYLAWTKESLNHLLDRNPSMRVTMQSVLSTDLTKKLTVNQ